MSPGKDARKRWDQSFPRVSGDEPYCRPCDHVDCAFSPRERG